MKKIFLGLFLISLILLLTGNMVSAQDEEEKVDDLQDKIEEYEKKIANLQKEANTLSREIESYNNQISLTQLKIQNSINKIAKTEKEINKLGEDIDSLVVRIDKLIERIQYQQNVLRERIRERYKTRETSTFMIIFGTTSLNNLVKKAEYLKAIEVQDNKVLAQMHETKETFNKQKTLFEEKKDKEESLKQQLVSEKANLDAYKLQLENKKQEQKRLLEVTQNNEVKYQKMLSDAKKELDQITSAVSVLKNQGSTDVEKGQKIGTQGNTGYSFGDHLHFGVYKYSSFEDIDGWDWYYSNYVDPAKKLKKKTVNWDDGCGTSDKKTVGSGDWSWPIEDPTVSQGFGHTCWSDRYYGGKDHPAYDMYGSYGASVHAADDGKAFFCDNCLGDGANGVFIFHDDDYMTIYWHLQ
ncbi:hypothetical protein A2V49_02755 [candidate division WWE3 bacterium RBG_19FT_COMBO_34_6]|uniref:Peptidoglycan hydrolase PcsB coiled-coil domain-containing protein n=1 Tax=candidate division WWE3 bacterium RBG_19FT_COMBO_34_6 TaxID=1802612 RepID=A0A1F4UNC0_UNCKA|nr:MAG: hypothetical protein A2V49_02755 [candidate division WWE3 bacterium RBG_19FT_COMBO_34_6]